MRSKKTGRLLSGINCASLACVSPSCGRLSVDRGAVISRVLRVVDGGEEEWVKEQRKRARQDSNLRVKITVDF